MYRMGIPFRAAKISNILDVPDIPDSIGVKQKMSGQTYVCRKH